MNSNANYNASHITYFLLCHRKLWLHHHGMRMEDNSVDVQHGKQLEKQVYDRRPQRWRELSVGSVKIDHYDPKLRVVREVKKSPKLEYLHITQVHYYLYQLEKYGLSGATGLIEYPKQRKTTKVELSDAARAQIERYLSEITKIVSEEVAPPAIKKSYCSNCAFYDFCYC
ncbi:MAG: CRISPR-associated protein Cas4 [Saprospiraceae bacterium]